MLALMVGRPPKPEALKRMEGTLRPDRSNPAAPAATALDALPCPPGLTEREQAAWEELAAVVAPMRVVTTSDLPAFRQMVYTLALVEDLRATLQALGLTFTVSTESGEVVRKRPEAELLATFKKQLASELAQFGLTPAARQRVSALGEQTAGDPLDEFAA
jgi:P27 family predicted phage terminase small subunit